MHPETNKSNLTYFVLISKRDFNIYKSRRLYSLIFFNLLRADKWFNLPKKKDKKTSKKVLCFTVFPGKVEIFIFSKATFFLPVLDGLHLHVKKVTK